MTANRQIQSRSSQLAVQSASINGWLAILGLIALTSLAILLGFAKTLNYGFPALALAVGGFLFLKYPLLYNGFTWWIWFLAPLVRRLVDFRVGFSDPSPILLTPYLVTLLTLITFFRWLPSAPRLGAGSFVMASLGILYGYLIGLIKTNPVAATIGLLDWISPVAFSFHLFINWRNYPSYRQNIQRVFLWFVLVAGAYGIFQYLVAPAWDCYWLENVTRTGNTSFGRPEPLQIRVWSIMHGPGVFGFAMMAGLLLLLSSLSPLCLPATGVGYLSFLLSQVRSAWLGWAVGLLFLMTSLKPKFQMRLFLIILVVSLCVIPLTTVKPFAEVINSRIESMSDVSGDKSAEDRQGNYSRWLSYGLTNGLGDGIGATRGVILDSAILDSLVSLGGFGTLFYATGLAVLIIQFSRAANLAQDPFASTARAIAFCLITQIPLGAVIIEFPGMLLWSFLGIGLAANQYYLHQHHLH